MTVLQTGTGSRVWELLGAIILCLSIGYEIGSGTVMTPSFVRLCLAMSITLTCAAVGIRYPRTVMLLMVICLPFLGFLRRLLIPVSGWSTYDPLVVMVPTVTLLMGSYVLYRRYFLGDTSLGQSPIVRLVLWMILVDLLEVVNPLQGSILAGIGGIIFYVVPLFWMLLGREHFTERWMGVLFNFVVVVGLTTALYGLKQTFIGFAPFESTWIALAGYTALNVGGQIRAFSTFTSSAEYAQFLAITLAILWAFLLHGSKGRRFASVLVFPVVAYALFMESTRGPIITTAVAIAFMTVASARKGHNRWGIGLVCATGLVVVYTAISHVPTGGNAFVAHQVNGLRNPFNSKYSTLSIHLQMMLYGILGGFTTPIGHGLGSTTISAAKFGGTGGSMEVDFSNMFLSDGIVGGVIYLLLLMRVLGLGIRAAVTRDVTSTAILGVMVATLTSWSIGGNYSTAALIWLCIGYLDKKMVVHNCGQATTGTDLVPLR